MKTIQFGVIGCGLMGKEFAKRETTEKVGEII